MPGRGKKTHSETAPICGLCKKLFSTMAIGSLPRPQWIIDIVNEREAGCISKEEFEKKLDAAVLFALGLQEKAGLDIVSDGEWRRRTYFTGFSTAVAGFEPDVIEVSLLTGGSAKWPAVVSKLEYGPPIAADEARFLNTTRPGASRLHFPVHI